MRVVFQTVLAVTLFAACGDNLPGGVLPPPDSCLPDCTAARGYDAIAYHLGGSWDWDGKKLTASEDITLDTTTSGPIVELDAAVAVTRVHAGDQELAFNLDTAKHTLAVDATPVGAGSATAFTVEYTAVSDGTTSQTTATSLIATTSLAADPVQTRVVYTDSEPDRALFWLVTNLDPSDRALWSIDLAVDPSEDVISNGERGSDVMTDGKRVVSYSLDKPIPAYLMAFASGQLEHTDRPAANGLVPISVWYRHGLVIDPDVTLDAIERAMTTFNAVVMPYPWERYSVVLLPYGGGMENATITFDDETSGQGNGDFVLTAHELSHHWFGDWVTMHGFDDVWFKEGMATVMESVAELGTRDRGNTGRMWGTDFGFNPQDAVVDDSLHGLDKYTSGPYERAGWMITQIRATVGDDAFWGGLRAMLAAHAVGSVTGEEFIRSFPLDEATVQKLLAALPQTAVPDLGVSVAGANLTLTLLDPGNVMIAPYDVVAVDATGAAVTATHVTPGTPVTVTVPAGGYLSADERDVHPPLYFDFGVSFQTYETLAADLAPVAATASAGVLGAFDSRSAAMQEKATEIGLVPVATPADMPAYLAALDSDVARNSAVIAACEMARTTGDNAWLTAVEPALETPADARFDERFEDCGTTFARATLEPEIATALASGTPADLARVEYLLSFDYGADEASVVTPIASGAPSLRLREIAGERMQNANAAHAPKRSTRSHRRAK